MLRLPQTLTAIASVVLLASTPVLGAEAMHWARTNKAFTLKVVDSMTSGWTTPLSTSLQEWSHSEVIDLTLVAGDETQATRQSCPMTPGVVRVCNYSYGVNGWMGLTIFGMDSRGHIDRSSVLMNDSYANYYTYYKGLKNHVMCHELGHAIGLDHTSEDGSSQQSCMDYSTDINSQWPSGANYLTLLNIYSHLDSYNSYAGAPAVSSTTTGDTTTVASTTPTTTTTTTTTTGSNKNNGSCNGNAKKCGKAFEVPVRPMRVKSNRFEEVWHLPRGDGGMWVHHYFLAPQPPR